VVLNRKLNTLVAKQTVYKTKLTSDKTILKKINMTKLKNQVKSFSTVRVTKKNTARLTRIQAEKKSVQAKLSAIKAKLSKRGINRHTGVKIQKKRKVMQGKINYYQNRILELEKKEKEIAS